MTFLEIYNRCVHNLFGNSTPPSGFQAVMYGSRGIIANCHQKIQRDWNYWFMETSSTVAVTAGNNGFTLPTNFKEVVRCGFRFDDDAGNHITPLSPLNAGDEWSNFLSASSESDRPTFYTIYGGQLHLKPEPSENTTLYLRYYGYLTRLSADADEDTLCLHGYDAIINMSCSEYLKTRKEFNEAQAFDQQAFEALELLKKSNTSMRRAEILEIEYGGV